MSMPKFATPPQSFHTELKKKVSAYFEEVGTSQTGNFKLFLKAVILMVSFAFVLAVATMVPSGATISVSSEKDFSAPEFPKTELVTGTWNEGRTLRRKA